MSKVIFQFNPENLSVSYTDGGAPLAGCTAIAPMPADSIPNVPEPVRQFNKNFGTVLNSIIELGGKPTAEQVKQLYELHVSIPGAIPPGDTATTHTKSFL